MNISKQNKSRKEFLGNLLKGGILATLFISTPIAKISGLIKNPKIYFRENPDSIKRQK